MYTLKEKKFCLAFGIKLIFSKYFLIVFFSAFPLFSISVRLSFISMAGLKYSAKKRRGEERHSFDSQCHVPVHHFRDVKVRDLWYLRYIQYHIHGQSRERRNRYPCLLPCCGLYSASFLHSYSYEPCLGNDAAYSGRGLPSSMKSPVLTDMHTGPPDLDEPPTDSCAGCVKLIVKSHQHFFLVQGHHHLLQ